MSGPASFIVDTTPPAAPVIVTVGIDTGAPVGPYPHGFACTAHIHGVTLERLSEPPPHIAARSAAGELAAGLAAQ